MTTTPALIIDRLDHVTRGTVTGVLLETVVIDDPDGRELAVCLAENAAGFPLLVHAGSPGSRLLNPARAERAARHGFRPVSYDRPGYGLSTSRDGRTVADAAGDAHAIADALGWERLATWGHSGGGPFALACAALAPHRVSATCVFASLGPHGRPGLDFTAGRSPQFRHEIDLFFADRPTARREYREDAVAMLAESASPESWMSRWGARAGTDPAHSQELADHLAANVREAARQGDQGWWEDWAAYLSPWEVELGAIRCPVQLWHGEQDQAVPIAHGRWLAAQIPGVETHILAAQDHATIEVDHQDDALRWLRTQTQCPGGPSSGRG